MSNRDHPTPVNFIRQAIDEAVAKNSPDYRVVTRFPPEPNGYLHIGHAKAICLNFGIAEDYPNARCRLRFDDTNPEKESTEYMESIKTDVRWLGFDWYELCYASDYFEQLYEFATVLIRKGKAYVDSESAEEIRARRGTLTEPGVDSPYRNRSVEENLELFARMRSGEFGDGDHVLRAKIDMTSPNMNMRDPVLYRIRHVSHYRTADEWCIYPMYDFTQCLSDAIEGVTHSLCTLEFEDHRPLYDWIIDEVEAPCHPRQIEFSRLNLTYTVMSKRLLNTLVSQGHVNGWDDPRMPTLSGVRRRGFTPQAMRDFCERVGITKKDNTIDLSLLENSLREDLDVKAPRRMAVLDPVKVIITNYPGETQWLTAANHPNDPHMGEREVPFSRELFIERDDFMRDPPKKFFRLGPGREVRLRYGYYIRCEHFVLDESSGEVKEIHCTYDPETRGGWSPDGRKVKGTIHWVSCAESIGATVHLYDRLFRDAAPSAGDYASQLNPDSLITRENARLEPSLAQAGVEDRFQFERLGYFCLDPDARPDGLIFNRTVTLRDSWAKISKD